MSKAKKVAKVQRKIEDKLYAFIEAKLAGNGAAQEAIRKKDARAVFGYAMESLVGIREKGGNNKGPEVELLQETIGAAVGEAWCMSTVQSCIAFAEKATGVVSPIAASEHCLTVWAETPKEMRVKSIPARFAIIIWQHGKTQNGHTGCVIEYRTDGYMTTVEGNTESGLDSKGVIEREGGGVYMNKRNTKATSMHVVGYLKPFKDIA